MSYLQIYMTAADADIQAIWDALPQHGKSAWVKAAIREKARPAAPPPPAGLTATQVRRIIREELALVSVSEQTNGPPPAAEEDTAAARKLASMFG